MAVAKFKHVVSMFIDLGIEERSWIQLPSADGVDICLVGSVYVNTETGIGKCAEFNTETGEFETYVIDPEDEIIEISSSSSGWGVKLMVSNDHGSKQFEFGYYAAEGDIDLQVEVAKKYPELTQGDGSPIWIFD